jgi:hypothetical protein
VITTEEERDRISIFSSRGACAVTGGNEDVVCPAGELVADVDQEGLGDARSVDPWSCQFGTDRSGDYVAYILLYGSALGELERRPGEGS